MKKLFVLCFPGLLLAGCNHELPPVKSGYTARPWVPADSPAKTDLTPTQLQALVSWFADHQTGWKFEIADTPPGTLVCFQLQNGKSEWVNVQGDKVWRGNRYRLLTPEERKAIDVILLSFRSPPRPDRA